MVLGRDLGMAHGICVWCILHDAWNMCHVHVARSKDKEKKNPTHTNPYSNTLVVKVLAQAEQSERWVNGVSVLVGMKSRTSPLVCMSIGVDV